MCSSPWGRCKCWGFFHVIFVSLFFEFFFVFFAIVCLFDYASVPLHGKITSDNNFFVKFLSLFLQVFMYLFVCVDVLLIHHEATSDNFLLKFLLLCFSQYKLTFPFVFNFVFCAFYYLQESFVFSYINNGWSYIYYLILTCCTALLVELIQDIFLQ
jgi:hypothetical protein